MYIVTFYSFKGGVGRSMALANVAAELAKKGRRVLIVDFDLEAPGLQTFDFGSDTRLKGGVVDYVTEYLDTNRSPDLINHVRKCGNFEENGGEVWLMPAGNQDKNYSRRLSKIDWQSLYKNKSGYLFFEDIKAQWQSKISPDYVLIDSRTGHTDVGGICTRQLPNSVVFLFFPNEQNLIGLRKIVSSVEEESIRRKDEKRNSIETHFVSSNVPDLDDEDQILADRLIAFSRDLNYKQLTTTIHRYDSLALLNQEIFTLSRPRSRLAKEYRQLTQQIMLKNPEDIDGAASYLESLKNLEYSSSNMEKIFTRLSSIQKRHKDNPNILKLLASVKERLGDYEEAIFLVSKAIELGDNDPTVRLNRAKLLISTGTEDKALVDIKTALDSADLGFSGVRLAFNLVNIINPSKLSEILKSNAYLNLDEFGFVELIGTYLQNDSSRLELAEQALTSFIKEQEEHNSELKLDFATRTLTLVLIARGKFDEAIVLFTHRPSEEDDIDVLFNYAIAEWGNTKETPKDLFQLVLNKLPNIDFSVNNPNLKQCIALCFWAVGKKTEALEILELAIHDAMEFSESIFSCWSYLNLSRKRFIEDVISMKKMINGDSILPEIFKGHSQLF
ncbi:KGGVGR-motif variant AAA ATPase [Aliikangiella coralliicola]|uniref:AAA family ATPase n=1 Tax=Aliikangiella coralliicola TaxID=2592383 RepID=A0A545UG28_9GAMM|nr:AAA family ATPase [Aliikangiella coralliicola]TQV88353.1 AAA family ATPase [Aliikangiella coralliicola]